MDASRYRWSALRNKSRRARCSVLGKRASASGATASLERISSRTRRPSSVSASRLTRPPPPARRRRLPPPAPRPRPPLHISPLLEPVRDPGDRGSVAAQHVRDAAHRDGLVERLQGEELRRLEPVLRLDVEHPRTLLPKQVHAQLPRLGGRIGLRPCSGLRHVHKSIPYMPSSTMVEFFNGPVIA